MSLTNLSATGKLVSSKLSSSKSTESLYSSNSAKSAIHRRMMQRQMGRMSGNSEVRQRVVSARMLRLKTLQNQLSDALQHISNLSSENRLLRTLHKRQDLALSKYESSNAELPQLLQSHAEEVRIWQAKYRGLHSQNRELAHKLKQKDALLIQLSDQNKHLTQLNLDRKLEERETLANRVQYLEARIAEKDEEIKLLSRKNALMEKNLKSQLALEQQKLKEIGQKYEMTLVETGKSYTNVVERPVINTQQRRTTNSMLPRAVPNQNQRHSRHQSNNRGSELRLMNGKSIDSMDLSPNKRTARINRDHSNGDALNTNGNHHALEIMDARKKTIHVHNLSQFMRDESDSDENEMADERTYTKSDEDYEDSFDKASEESRNGQALTNVGLKDEYDDDNDLVLGDDTKINGGSSTDDYEHLLTNLSVKEDTNFNLMKMHTEYQGDIARNESVLDSFCDTLCKDVEIAVKIERGTADNGENNLKFGNRILNVKKRATDRKRPKMDEKKKTELLAALKAIDSKSGGDT